MFEDDNDDDSLGWVSSLSSSGDEEDIISLCPSLGPSSRGKNWSEMLKNIARKRLLLKRVVSGGGIVFSESSKALGDEEEKRRYIICTSRKKDRARIDQCRAGNLRIGIDGEEWNEEYTKLIDEKKLSVLLTRKFCSEKSPVEICFFGPDADRGCIRTIDYIFQEMRNINALKNENGIIEMKVYENENQNEILASFNDVPNELNQARFRRALTKVENALRQDSVVYISLVMTRKNIANMLHFFAYLKPSQDINNIQKMYLTLHKFLHHYVLVACVSTSDPGLWALGWLCKKSPETVQAQIVSFNAALNYVRPPTVSELIYRDKSLPPLEQSSPSNIYRNEKSQDYFLLQKEVAYYQDEILLDDPVVDQALDNRQLNTQEDSIQREEEDQDRVPQIKLDEKDYENIISMNKEEDNFNLEILEAETVNQTKLQFMIHQIRNLENERIRTKQKNVEIVQQFSDQLYKLKFAKIAADVAANAAVDLLGKSQQESHAALKLLENRVIHLERALKLAQDQAVNSEALLTHRLLLAESQNKLATATVERIRTAAANELECTLSEIRASVAGQAQAAHRALKTLADERDKLAQARISDQEELQAALTKLRQFEEREEKCLLENSEKKKKPNTEEEEKEEAQQANFKDKTTELLENNLREKQCELDELRASSRREAAALWLAVGKTEFYLNQQGEQEQQRNDEIIHKTPPQERAAVQTIIAPSADELTLTAELSSLDQKLAGLRNNNVHKNDDGIKRPLQSSKILGPRQTVERVEKTNKEVLNFLELSSESPQILSPSRILRKIEVEEGGVHHSFSDDDHPSPTDSYHQFSYSLSQLQDKHSPSSKQQQSNTNTRHSTSDVTPAYYEQRHQFDNSSSARVTKHTPTAKTLLDPITVHSFPSTLRSGLDSPGSVAVRTNNTFSSGTIGG